MCNTQDYLKIRLLKSELNMALALAVSRFKLQNRGILANLFGGILGSWKPELKK